MADTTQTVALLSFVVPASAQVAGAARTLPLAGPERVRDLEFGGPATLSGSTVKKVAGIEVPMRARVRLFRSRDGLLARETWSDPATGAYTFTGLDAATRFHVVADDADLLFEPEASRLLPT